MAFGFYGVDIGDQQGQLDVSLGNSTFGPPLFSFDVPHSISGPSGSVLFWGFVSDDPDETFRVLRFSNSGSTSDSFGFDDLTAAVFAPPATVSEPGSLALLGLFSVFWGGSRARSQGRRGQRERAAR